MADFQTTPNIGLAFTSDTVMNADLSRIDTEIGSLKEKVQNPAQPPPWQVPAGGTTGQVLAKKSDADYDVEWIDLPTP